MKLQPSLLQRRRRHFRPLLRAGASLHTSTSTLPPHESPQPSTDCYSLLTESMLVERILTSLKQTSPTSVRTHLSNLTPSVVVNVLYRCRDNLALGQKFVDLVVFDNHRFHHSSMSFSASIHVLVRARRFPEAQVLMLKMVRRSGVVREEIVDALVSSFDRCGSSLYVYDLLIRTYVQARKVREGVEAFRCLRKKGVVVYVNACNSLLGGLVKVGWIDLAREVFKEVVESGVGLNVYTLNIMVNGMCKENEIEKAKVFVDEMVGKWVFADNVMYNTLINAYSRTGRLNEVFEIMEVMSMKGFMPEVFTYNAII